MAHWQSDFESLFWEESFHPLRSLFQKPGSVKYSLADRHIDMLKITQETENGFFWQDAAASNLLAFLYHFRDKDDLAMKQLNLSLERAPNNLNAHEGLIRIKEENYRHTDAKKIAHCDGLKDTKEMEKQKMICRGEIAYACSFIGPDFYMQAVDRFEALLRDSNANEELKDHIVRWQYHLAYTYNRMMNKGHKEKLAEKLGTKDSGEIFKKIHELYDAVISSDDQFYKGRAMIDLVDTHKKCETSGKYPIPSLQFPYDCSPDQFVLDAMRTAPSDPHVLERCGRHYRQRACSKKDLDAAVAIFDELLELHPSRHVAWHHKGLACRALWHIVGKYDEARLYTNSARKGDKRRVKKLKLAVSGRASQTDDRRETSAAVASECHRNHNSSTVADQNMCDPPISQFACLSVDEQQELATNLITPTSRDGCPNSQSAPRELPTLPSYNRPEIGDAPKQLRKPDYFDKLRTSNPQAKDNRSRKFLEQSRECFEKAKKISKGTCSPYIVDLARSLISLGSYDDAELEFRAASKLACTMNHNDATYLYEQWALLRHRRAKDESQSPDDEKDKMKDVARIYRQAILSAVRARERSRVAFYNLRDLLEELLCDTNNTAIRLEYEVLRNSTEKFGQYKDMLVEALKKDEETRTSALDMIRLLRCRGHKHDAETAFVYLTALHEANLLDQLDLKEGKIFKLPVTPDIQKSNRQFLIDVVWQLVREEDQTNANSGQTFGEIFRWMVGTADLSNCITLEADIPKPFADSGEICILAPSDSTPGVDRMNKVLQDVCGVTVVKAFCDGNCDVPYGSPIIEGLLSVVTISQSVVVVENSTDTENWGLLSPVLKYLMTKDVKYTCFVVDCSCKTEHIFTGHWPRLTIDRSWDDIKLAYELLKTLVCPP